MNAHASEIVPVARVPRDPSLIRARRIGHATFTTPDLDRLVDYYTSVIGLTLTDRTADRAFLASTIDHHSLVLERGDAAACVAVAFRLAPDADLGLLERQIRARGHAATRATDAEPGVADALTMTAPVGTRVTLHADGPPAGQRFAAQGIVPFKLGHVAFMASDVQANVDWYCDALGFRVSDWLTDHFAFMRCGPDHHTINILGAPGDRMHHIGFELMDWGHVQRAADLLARHGIPLVWGPGRHGIGHNVFTYHRNPDGHIVELFCDLDRMSDEELGFYEPRPWHHDSPQRPKVWPDAGPAGNLWGVPPPPGLMQG